MSMAYNLIAPAHASRIVPTATLTANGSETLAWGISKVLSHACLVLQYFHALLHHASCLDASVDTAQVLGTTKSYRGALWQGQNHLAIEPIADTGLVQGFVHSCWFLLFPVVIDWQKPALLHLCFAPEIGLAFN